jgi:formyl-CoA transferase
MNASTAILAALFSRERSGQGQYIDIALLDSQVGWLVNVAQNHLVSGQPSARYGNAHPNIVPYEVFATSDGYLALGVGNDRQFQRLCEILERPDLRDEPRFCTNPLRVEHRQALIPMLQEKFHTRPTAHWLAQLEAFGIPAGPINDIPAVFQHPQVLARDMLQTITHPTVGAIPQPGPVAKLSGTPASIQRPPPRLGEHTADVLRDELACDEAYLTALARDGVIRLP